MAEELDERSEDIMPFAKSIMPFTNCQDRLHHTKHVNVDTDEDYDADGDEQTGIMNIKDVCKNEAENDISTMQSPGDTSTTKSIVSKLGISNNQKENHSSTMQCSDETLKTKSININSGFCDSEEENDIASKQSSGDTPKTKSSGTKSGFCDSEKENDISTKQSSDKTSKSKSSGTKSVTNKARPYTKGHQVKQQRIKQTMISGIDDKNLRCEKDITVYCKLLMALLLFFSMRYHIIIQVNGMLSDGNRCHMPAKSWYPIFGIAIKETYLTDKNQMYWQTFSNIHSTTNYTFLLQDMNFVHQKAVNRKILFKDVDSSLNNSLECDKCKGEIHNLCSHGTAYFEEHEKKSDTIITQNLDKAITIENTGNYSDHQKANVSVQEFIVNKWRKRKEVQQGIYGLHGNHQKAEISGQEFKVNKWRKREKVQQGIDNLHRNFEEHWKKSDTTIMMNLDEAITIENTHNNSDALKGRSTRQKLKVNKWRKRKKVQHGIDDLHGNPQKAEMSAQEFKVNKWRKREKVQQRIDDPHGNFEEHGKKSDTTIMMNLDEAITIENTHNNSETLKGRITRKYVIVNRWKKRKKVQHGTYGLHENHQKAGTSRHEFKVNTWIKRRKVQQGIHGLYGSDDNSKNENERSKIEATDTGLILIVFLLSFCKVSTHEYILFGIMMMLPVGYSDDIPTNSLKLVLVGDIIYGKTVVLECMTENKTGLCDLENQSRRWTQGSSRSQLVTNGKSVNESKFEEVVNKNCTHLKLKLKNFKEMDMNMEYTFEYGFQKATLNLTLNKSSYKWYPLVETVVNDVQVFHHNLTLDLTFRNINPIPNCTVILQNISFPLEILNVNESTFYYDVVFRFTHLIECVRCKEEIRILCSSLGTTYEYEKKEYYECCLGSMAEQTVSIATVVSIIVSIFGVAAAVFVIFCKLKQKRKNMHKGATNTQHIELDGLITTTQLHTREPLILAESENLRNS